MADILVTSPFQPFTLPTQFKAVFNGYIYCGTVDAVDPSVSQVQVYLVNESGDKVPVSQPLRTNSGGYLVYNGQPAKFVTDSNHSLLVQDSFHAQIWYVPDVFNVDPESAMISLGVQIREALRRSYAEAGHDLVSGSFEDGGTLADANDVMLHKGSGKAYSHPGPYPKIVAAGTNPSTGGFVDRSESLLKISLSLTSGAGGIGATSGRTVQEEITLTSSNKNAAVITQLIVGGTPITIACFGDSTMYGYEVGGATGDVQDPNNPPKTLNDTLFRLYGRAITVINAAVSGLAMDLHILQYEAKIAPGGIAENAHVCYCNLGINDCQNNNDLEVFRENYVKWVSLTRKYGKVPILVTPNPITPFETGDARESNGIAQYAEVIRSVAKATNCDLVDTYYWVKQTAKAIPETVLIPDGVHPETETYKQNGRNLAIPLISANRLTKVGDIASLSGATVNNAQNATILERSDIRTGVAYYGSKAIGGSIDTAVIIEEPFDTISVMGLQWIDGSRMLVGSRNDDVQWGIHRTNKSYGSSTDIDWDTEFTLKTNNRAGLHSLYWLFDATDTSPTSLNAVLSGFSVPKQTTVYGVVPIEMGAQYKKDMLIQVGYKVTFSHTFVIGDSNPPTFIETSGFVTMKMVLVAGDELKIELYGSSGLVSSTLIAGGVVSGTALNVDLTFDATGILFKGRAPAGGAVLSFTVPISSELPPVLLSNTGKSFSISPK